MLRNVRRFWDLIVFAGLIVGIIYLPADIFGLAQAYPTLGRAAAMIDRFTLLAGFALLLVAYIAWIDFRPIYQEWRKKKLGNLLIEDSVWWQSTPIDLEDKKSLAFRNECFFIVINTNKTGRTLSNVKITDFIVDRTRLLPSLDGRTTVDLQHGEQARFCIGKIIAPNAFGLVELGLKPTDFDKSYANYVDKGGDLAFHTEGDWAFGSGEPGGKWPYGYAVVTADDELAIPIRYEVDFSKENLAPVSITSIG